MGQVVVVGLDIAKSAFATLAPCRIGIEACATGTIGRASWARSGTMSG